MSLEQNIINITEEKIPTIVAYSNDKERLVIGNSARITGLEGKTTVFNFKPDIGKGDAEYSKKKKYWYYLAPTNEHEKKIDTFSAKEAAVVFLRELVRDIELPEQILIGEPAVRDKAWRDNFRRHIREIIREINSEVQVQFFPEPFAVFQYYRNTLFPQSKSSELVLVIDIGGGTFNSCIIKTTDEGYLSRGGGTSLPLGLQAEQCGGNEIDRGILEIIVKNAQKMGIKWKDDPYQRADAGKSPIMLHVEDVKIELSNLIGDQAKLSKDFSELIIELDIEEGMLHPDKAFSIQITGEDLKDIIRKMWRKNWGDNILKTINEAKDKLKALNFDFKKLDKVIVAGGCSKLPFMKEEIHTVLPTRINKKDIHMAPYLGRAVAAGLACECTEQLSRNPQLSVGKIAPCLLNDLFLAFKKTRKSSISIPKIKYPGQSSKIGQLISEPFIIEDLKITYDFEMPFEPSDRIFYYFSDQPFDNENDFMPLNLSNDVFSLDTNNKIIKKWKLEIKILKNGSIKPTFIFKEKGKGANKDGNRRSIPEFKLPNFRLEEGDSFIGIDFGTSNSYVVQILKPMEEEVSDEYPEFSLKEATLENLRKREQELIEFKENKTITTKQIIKFYKDQMLSMVFHSNKIEGNPLTKGETELVIKKGDDKDLNKNQREAYNLEKAYMWTLDNYKSCFDEPEGFIRTLNKMILENISKGGGEYRLKSVKISGVDFKPPISATVPVFMEKLSNELKVGVSERSAIEYAATMHTKLVAIHPFIDGNGRTARLLMNAILLNFNVPPIIVNFDDKQRYLGALSNSNEGDISPLVEFFIECFKESIDNYSKALSPLDTAEQEVDQLQCEIEGENNGEDPIRSALKEVGAVISEDPLKAVMQTKIEKQKELLKSNYESWQNCFSGLKHEFIKIINEFNSTEEYRVAGFKMNLSEYDMISFEKYMDFCYGKKVTRTWFIGLEIIGPSNRERFLLFFVSCTRRAADIKNLGPISLILARSDGVKSRILQSEPISIREIGFSNDELIFFYSNNEIVRGNVNKILKTLFSEIIKSYL